MLSDSGELVLVASLAIQFAAQPLLVRTFVSPEVITTSLVLSGEVVKLVVCLLLLVFTGRLVPLMKLWTPAGSLNAALPSASYALQNLCMVTAYRHLDGVTFNVLIQTKLLFTAVFARILRGRGQSRTQWLALFLIFAASAWAALGAGKPKRQSIETVGFSVGVIASIAGAVFSGFGAVVSEKVLVEQKRDALLFSAELAAGGTLVVFLSLLLDLNGDGTRLANSNFKLYDHWTPVTCVPVMTCSTGGILVGIITKKLGSVKKALTVTVGLLLSAVLTAVSRGQPPSPEFCAALALVICGIRLYTSCNRATAVPTRMSRTVTSTTCTSNGTVSKVPLALNCVHRKTTYSLVASPCLGPSSPSAFFLGMRSATFPSVLADCSHPTKIVACS